MIVMVYFADGSCITPSYSPEHYDAVKKYYAEELRKGLIQGYILRK